MKEGMSGGMRSQDASATNSHGVNEGGNHRSYSLPQSGVLTDDEWAIVLECEKRTFRQHVRERRIPYIPYGKGIFVSAEDWYRYGKVVYDEEAGERRWVDLSVGERLGGLPDSENGGGEAKANKPPRRKP